MQVITLTAKDRRYPKRLAPILGSRFPEITAIGNLDILADPQTPITGLFCSRNCPGSLILPSFDHISALRDAGRTVASGFHSEMEQECLKILLRGSQPIIICPARAIHNMRLTTDWKKSLEENRLLIVSPFDQNQKRATAELAYQRNKFVAALADELFVIHGKRGTGTLNMVIEAMKAGKKTFTINDIANQALIKADVALV
jgi:predicted Rossmann fold nucleotide-binding protein DprA/Smf involved in DNA uptake